MDIKYPPKGWTSKGDFAAHGKLKNKEGEVIYKFDGHWREFGQLLDPKTSEVIQEWKTEPFPENFEKEHYFSECTMNLNNLTNNMLKFLPPTDSRLRPDMRAYEYGEVDLASEEK